MKIACRRAVEIGLVVGNALREGYGVGFGTLTMRHHQGQSLEELWDALAGAWNAVTSGSGWVRDKSGHGVEGWLRAVEVTYGENGWHVHIHLLVVGRFDAEELESLFASMWARWARSLERSGLAAPLPIGSDVQLVTDHDWSRTGLAEYLGKGVTGAGGIGRELTMSQGKQARQVNSTEPVWALLDAFCETGELVKRKLWHEWEQVSKGKRQLTWSKGFRERFGMAQEQSDEEIAAEEVGAIEDTVVWITKRGWKRVIELSKWVPGFQGTPFQLQILEVVEAGGQEAVCRFLDEHGVEYRLPKLGRCEHS